MKKTHHPIFIESQDLANNQNLILSIALLFIGFLGFYYWPLLSLGSISRFDEFLTLDRSFSILRNNDWLSITLHDKPDFNKPPLHYWLTALALQNFNDTEFALRLFPFIEGLCLLLATGFLAYALKPKHPLVILISIIIFSSSKHLWSLSTSALLDTGDCLFFTLTLTFLILALQNSKFWYWVGISIILGSLQKSPLCFLLVGLILFTLFTLKKYHEIDPSKIFGSNHLKISFIIVIIFLFLWPTIQFFNYGFDYVNQYYGSQIFSRFSPSLNNNRVHLIKLMEWIIKPNPLFFFLSVISIPFASKFLSKSNSIILITIIVSFILLMKFSSGVVFSRYTFLIEPILSAYFSIILVSLIPNFFKLISVSTVAALLTGHTLIKIEDLYLNQLDKFYPVLSTYKKEITSNDNLVLCQFDTGVTIINQVAFDYYAVDHKKFTILGKMDDLKTIPASSNKQLLGLCRIDQYEIIKSKLNNPKVLYIQSNHLIWRSN